MLYTTPSQIKIAPNAKAPSSTQSFFDDLKMVRNALNLINIANIIENTFKQMLP